MSSFPFLSNLGLVVAVMGACAAVEGVLPLVARPPDRRAVRHANLRLMAANVAANWVILSVGGVLAAGFALESSGLLARLETPATARLVVGVIVLDLGYGYVAHRLMHQVPALWRVHRVHHSDPFVDVTTTFRNHPLESVWRQVFIVLPVAALGLPAEAVALHRLLSTTNAVLEHANIRLWPSLDRALSWVWVTPDMHKVHHSREQRETDSNYGNLFAVFDRVLATFTPTVRALHVTYGIDEAPESGAVTLRALLAAPFSSGETARGTLAARNA